MKIPKPAGGTRNLGIPTVIDRVIQQAVLQRLQPRWDPTFSEHSYGFRPGRSPHQADGPVDPVAILEAIAADARLPSSSRVAAAKALLTWRRAQKGGEPFPKRGKPDPAERIRALALGLSRPN